jgi:hypothetical protein
MKGWSATPLILLPLFLGNIGIARAEQYPETVTAEFLNACKTSAKQSAPNLSDDAISSYCQCAINQIQTRISLSDFVGLDKALASGKTMTSAEASSAQALNASVQYCTKQ